MSPYFTTVNTSAIRGRVYGYLNGVINTNRCNKGSELQHEGSRADAEYAFIAFTAVTLTAKTNSGGPRSGAGRREK